MSQKKLTDYLWAARGAIKDNRPELAYEYITEALNRSGAILYPDIEEAYHDRPERPRVIHDVTYSVPEFIEVRGVQFKERGDYKSPSGNFKGLVVHYTVSNRTSRSAVAVLKYLAANGLGCMVMDELGKIYVAEGFNPLRDTADHAGKSEWNGLKWLNRHYAGIEVCCWGKGSKVGPFRTSEQVSNVQMGRYQQFTAAQEASLINLCLWALDVNPEFKIENIAGHDEVRAAFGLPGDKSDPGASLSMTMPEFRTLIARLAENGLG